MEIFALLNARVGITQIIAKENVLNAVHLVQSAPEFKATIASNVKQVKFCFKTLACNNAQIHILKRE